MASGMITDNESWMTRAMNKEPVYVSGDGVRLVRNSLPGRGRTLTLTTAGAFKHPIIPASAMKNAATFESFYTGGPGSSSTDGNVAGLYRLEGDPAGLAGSESSTNSSSAVALYTPSKTPTPKKKAAFSEEAPADIPIEDIGNITDSIDSLLLGYEELIDRPEEEDTTEDSKEAEKVEDSAEVKMDIA